MSSTVEGELQSLSGEGFEGWAWDSLRPYDPVEVEILCNGAIVATAYADGFSLDLVKQRKGNGMHTFCATLGALPKAQYPLRIQARVKGYDVVLSGAITISSPSEFLAMLPRSLFQDFEGYLDGVKDGKVIGWARNAAIPEEPVEVELLDGNRVLCAVLATRYRADVEQQMPGAGESGFEFALPYDLLDGEMHNLRVRVSGTRYELGNSPISFGPGSANALVKEILRLRDFVQSWDSRQDDLARELMARFEALYSIQRDAFERELQAIKTAALGFPRVAESEPLIKIVPKPQIDMPVKMSEPHRSVRPDESIHVTETEMEKTEYGQPSAGSAPRAAQQTAESGPAFTGSAVETPVTDDVDSKLAVKQSRRKRG